MAELKQWCAATPSTPAPWKPRLLRILKSASPKAKVALVGVGHHMRADDYVGSFIVKKLMNRTRLNNVVLFDAEDEIESIISKIAACGPSQVVVVDACEMNAAPATVDLLPIADTDYPFFTTHGIPLKLLASKLLPKSATWILTIQPGEMGLTERLSPEVLAAANAISDFITAALKESAQNA